jgi:YfiH family protein
VLSRVTVPALEEIPGLAHGFEERPPKGEGREEGRTRTRAALAGDGELLFLRQVHGSRIVEAPWEAPPEADGAVATRPGLLLGIETADCLPVLLVDPGRRRVAAVHAGWRGTAQRIVGEAVRALHEAGSRPSDLVAALGPAIGVCCYEVGGEVVRAIPLPGCVEQVAGRIHFDLRLANRLQLLEAGVKQIHDVSECTRCGVGRFHSYRRDGKGTGRMVNFVGFRST